MIIEKQKVAEARGIISELQICISEAYGEPKKEHVLLLEVMEWLLENGDVPDWLYWEITIEE